MESKEAPTLAPTWTNFENTLRESSQSQKDKYRANSIYTRSVDEASPQRQNTDWWLPGAGGEEKWGVTSNGGGVSFWGAEKVLGPDSGDGCTTWRIPLDAPELYTSKLCPLHFVICILTQTVKRNQLH